MLEKFGDKAVAQKILEKIKEEAKGIEELRFMHVCGTHEDTVTRSGIRSLLPENVKIMSGPGCPVCITPVEDIVKMMEIMKVAREEREEIILTTFGDMYRIPTPIGSFADLKSQGYDVRIVYSIYDSYKIAKENPDKLVVHFSPGFETTAAPTAGMLESIVEEGLENFKIYSVHRLTPPAVEALLNAGTVFHGLIDPGHVSTIIGVKGWAYLTEKFGIPQVVAGFEPVDVLLGILILIRLVKRGEAKIINEYNRVVKWEGNVKAQELIWKYFEVKDAKWRALGVIPRSGLELKKEWKELEIRTYYNPEVPKLPDLEKGCLCGAVLRGLALPTQCQHFGKTCTPRHPVGPCMVSYEGTCHIFYKYGALM
ncbi:hydrogenase formation protein HypD [Pyrococcus furiosus DSM 3638]|uniref:Hydrogenase formation protein HypD n=3 Tax=Pyrococcus furiosus TaxID=2261 RepID=A0A5C0XU22_PYRFU|nr:hydrogenase formation protein HypD [Pyrococcus furiosus]AAL80673.1 hydrogenase expression/formation protein [Pyrococcus furiosus DSM 3638]AFN03345.1 hydrogenase isoenzymes formation protein HypD [Pyrococcus furiosus COM1]QEK78260.1 hydrogenase formation protein HypD [Pyrococcus furiosus DSM 3638]